MHERHRRLCDILDSTVSSRDKPFCFIDTGDVAAGAHHIRFEFSQTPLEAAFKNAVKNLDIVPLQAGGDLLQFKRLTNHNVFEPYGMTGNRWANQ